MAQPLQRSSPCDAPRKVATDRQGMGLRAKNIGALVVTSENAVLGLISEREIVHAFSRYGETAGSMRSLFKLTYNLLQFSEERTWRQWERRRTAAGPSPLAN